ncbi:MAG: hypothetical protein R3A79_03530 [Nannocystaceae bacterium]
MRAFHLALAFALAGVLAGDGDDHGIGVCGDGVPEGIGGAAVYSASEFPESVISDSVSPCSLSMPESDSECEICDRL